jgi:hypothetical protein
MPLSIGCVAQFPLLAPPLGAAAAGLVYRRMFGRSRSA